MTFLSGYDLGEFLGSGAFSVVKMCREKSSEIQYAVKIIDITPAIASGRQRIKERSLQRETHIGRQFKHKNVLQIHDVFIEGPIRYFVIDLMIGGDLTTRIQTSVFDEEKAAVSARQILEGVAFIHRNDIVHRDLKPANILLESNSENLKISDFGLAIFAPNGALDWYGHAGTVGYMSPEVLKREKYGKPVDMWAVGAILFFMLSGLPAFWDDDIEELKKITISGNFTFSANIWETISENVKILIQKMLDLDQKNRILPEKALKNSWIKLKK